MQKSQDVVTKATDLVDIKAELAAEMKKAPIKYRARNLVGEEITKGSDDKPLFALTVDAIKGNRIQEASKILDIAQINMQRDKGKGIKRIF